MSSRPKDVPYDDLFQEQGSPCGPDRIADIEQNTGRELPPAYRDLVMATGGGICHPGMRVRSRKMQVRGRTVTRILGNGVLGDVADNSLDSAAVRDLVPDFPHHFICALTETPSQWFIILRDRTLFPPAPAGAVALFDDEHRVFYRVASSFAGFLGNWRGKPRSFPHRRWIRLLSTRFIGRSRGFRCPATSCRLPVIAVWRSRVR